MRGHYVSASPVRAWLPVSPVCPFRLCNCPRPVPSPARHLAQAELTDQVQRALQADFQLLLGQRRSDQRTRQGKGDQLGSLEFLRLPFSLRSIWFRACISRSCSFRPNKAASRMAPQTPPAEPSGQPHGGARAGFAWHLSSMTAVMRGKAFLPQQRRDQQRPKPRRMLQHLDFSPGVDQDQLPAQHGGSAFVSMMTCCQLDKRTSSSQSAS